MKKPKIVVQKASRALCHLFYQQLVQDPDLFADSAQFVPYEYDPQKVDAKFQHDQNQPDRKTFYITLENQVIGEVGLKHINQAEKSCELTICMISDPYKNCGYGTQAEKWMLQYAFEKMGMRTVLADALLKNTRSQHVLEKVGFTKIGKDDLFQYYKCVKP